MITVTTLTHESIDQFLNYLSERGRAANTIRAYGSDLRELMRFSDSLADSDSFQSSVAKWLTATRAKAAPKTTGRRLVSARAYAKWAGFGDILDDYKVPTPARTIPHPLPEGIDGVKRMCEATREPSQKALYALQGMAGLRVSEARELYHYHFDLDDMTMTVRGKGDKTRIVPIAKSAWPYLQPAYEQSLATGAPLVDLSDRGARKAVTAMGKRLKFKRSISSHDLRATGATYLYDRTKDIRVVQDFLGHSSPVTTQIYTAASMDAMREGLEF